MSNTKKQNEAVDIIHKTARDANMLVFMLVDEDLDMLDDTETLTQDEKNDIWERMHESFLDHYGEMLQQVVQEVIDERAP
jgi:hypothetical protein